MKQPHLEPFKGKDGQWYYRLVAANGQTLMTSEGYSKRRKRDQLAIKRACKLAGCDKAVICDTWKSELAAAYVKPLIGAVTADINEDKNSGTNQ